MIIENIFEIINQGWFGSFIGSLGIVVAIYFYKRSKVGARIVYQMKSLKIIERNEKTPEEIEIYYKGIKVPRIIKTTIILWNSGANTIEGQQIVQSDPLRLEFSKGEEIISASIIKRTKEVNEFEIKTKEDQRNILYLNFEYLDPKDGVAFEILHTDINRYPNFIGSIKGIPKGPINWGIDSTETINLTFLNKVINQKYLLWTMLVIGVLVISSSFIIPNHPVDTEKFSNAFFYSLFFAGLIYIIFPLTLIWSNRRKYPKALNIEKFELNSKKTNSILRNNVIS